MDIKEDVLYCDYCGGSNRASAVECVHCNHKMKQKHPAFLVFLKAHTKDKFLGKAKDTVFSKIQGFLMSHIYGTVISLLVVTTASANMINKDSHIEKVQAPPAIAKQQQPAPPQPVTTELTDEDTSEIYDKMHDYIHITDENLTGYAVENEDENGNIIPSYTRTMSQILLDPAKVTVAYTPVHHIGQTGSRAITEQKKNEGLNPTSAYSNTMFLTNDELTSDLAKQFRDAGYEVAENMYSFLGYYDGRVNDFTNFYELTDYDYRYDYTMVYVKVDGEWYIANDARI